MSMVRPSFVENLFNTFFGLESDRPMYYHNVYRVGRSIFKFMGDAEALQTTENMIHEIIEVPLNTSWLSLIHAYYNPRFMMSKRAYTKVGDTIDYTTITRYEIMMNLEKIKDYIYDRVTDLSTQVRFTNQQPILPQ